MKLIDAELLQFQCENKAANSESDVLRLAFSYLAELVKKAPDARRPKPLNDLMYQIYADAIAHGLYCDINEISNHMPLAYLREMLAVRIADEVDEARSCADDLEHYTDELADIIIMTLSAAGRLGINIQDAVEAKMKKNHLRPFQHIGE